MDIGKLKKFKMNQKGQADLIGNLIEIIKTQPFILPLLFLALIYGTVTGISILGINLDITLILQPMLDFIGGVFNINLDWRLMVIIFFLFIPVSFIIYHANW